MNHKNFHRAFTEIHLLTDDIKERGKTEYLYIPNQAMGLYYTSRNYPELGEKYFRRALEGIDTLTNTVAVFNTYLSLAQALSFNHPDEAMSCLDHLPKSMLENPMYDSGVLGYRCIIAHKQGDLDSFNQYFEQYDSIRKNLADQFNATNLYQVMVCHGLMHHDYQSALAGVSEMDDINHQIPQEEYMLMRSEISRSAHHVASSVHELMELCLTDENMKMEKNERVDLNEIVLATLSSYDLRNRELQFDFYSVIDDSINILTNQNAMQEIINCLLSNADRYATGGTVKLRCQKAPNV